VGHGRIEIPPSAQRVLAFLALQERPVTRSLVAGSLWPDAPEERAASCLRSALWRLHLPGGDLVHATRPCVSLEDSVALDLREFRALTYGLMDGTYACDRIDPRSLRLGGELLPDWYEDWLVIERERYRQLRLHALEKLCLRLSAAGDYSRAIEAGLWAVDAEPLRESARRALISAFVAEGNHAEARRHYRLYERLAQRELGVGPSTELTSLLGSLR
jgi:DNA-binding SARP family transcriptional activator